jgi:mRNA-degrading endonuclease RelE of RelBE toxin-antitoxin system
MNVEVIWYKEAINFLRTLDKNNSSRIVNKMDNEIKINPKRYVLPLMNKKESKIRIGNYRLFVNYLKAENKLIILSIRHRKNAYKD